MNLSKLTLVTAMIVFTSIANAFEFGIKDFNFVAPIVPSTSAAPDQVGLIVYDSTEKLFYGRSSDITTPWQALSNVAFVPVAPTVTVYTSGSGTFTTPAGALYLKVRMIGGGGGGGSGGLSGTTNVGTAGGNTTFGSSLLVANGGGVDPGGINPGGTASLGTGPTGIALTGADGGNYIANGGGGNEYYTGGVGASTPFGGGAPGLAASLGLAAKANTGAGGGGGGGNSNSGAMNAGPGGAAGGYVEAMIVSPASSYSYSVGEGGTGGTGGNQGYAGGAGGSGIIIVETHFN